VLLARLALLCTVWIRLQAEKFDSVGSDKIDFKGLIFLKSLIVDGNFVPIAATWRTQRNITSSLIVAYWLHCVQT